MPNPDANQNIDYPFRSTASRPFIFASPIHEFSVDRLVAGVRARRALQVLIGEPGTGKSTLLHVLLESIPEHTQTLFCYSSAIDSGQLLTFVAEHLPDHHGSRGGPPDLESFQRLLRMNCPPDHSLLVIVDEAQHLAPSALDLMLDITDWSASSGGRALFVAAGDEELERRLSEVRAVHPSIRGAEELRLSSLSAEQVGTFIDAQLKRGNLPSETFSAAALAQVALISRGLPRLVNTICGHALLMAQSFEDSQVTEAHVRATAEDLQLTLGGSRCGHALLLARSYANSESDKVAPPPGSAQPTEQSVSDREELNTEAPNSALFAALARRAQTSSDSVNRPSTPNAGGSPTPSFPDNTVMRADPREGSRVEQNTKREESAAEGGEPGRERSTLEPMLGTTEPTEPQDACDAPAPSADRVSQGHGEAGTSRSKEPTGRNSPAPPPEVRLIPAAAPETLGTSDNAPVTAISDRERMLASTPSTRRFRPTAIAAGIAAVMAGAGAFYQLDGSRYDSHFPLLFRYLSEFFDNESISPKPIDIAERATTGSGATIETPTWLPGPVKVVAVHDSDAQGKSPTPPGDDRVRVALQQDETPATAAEVAEVAGKVEALRSEAARERASGNLDAAVKLVEQAIALAPQDTRLTALRDELIDERQRKAALIADLQEDVRAHQSIGNYVEAMATVAKALKLEPGSPELLALRDEIESQHKGALERTRIARKVAQLDGDARSQLTAGDYQAARALVETALELAPDHPALLALQEQIATEGREAAERVRIARDVQRLEDEARVALASNDHDLALARIDEALALSDDDGGNLQALRGEAVAQQQAAKEREQVAAEIGRLKADGRDLIGDGDLDAAEERLERIFELSAEDSEAEAMREEIGEIRAAIGEAERIASEVENLRATARRALAAEDYETALNDVTAALKLSPRDPESQLLKREVEARRQDALERQRIAGEVLRLEVLARAAMAGGDFDAALERADQGLSLAPDSPDLGVLRNEIAAQREAALERARVKAETARLSEQARASLADEVFDKALARAREALGLAPGDADLMALLEEIEALQEAKIQQQRLAAEVAKLDEEIRAALEKEDFDTAQAKVEAGLALAPENGNLLELQQQVEAKRQAALERERIRAETARLQDEARASLAADDHERALVLTRQGLDLSPEDTDLLALAEEIQTQLAAKQEQERIAAEVARLAAAARTALGAEDFQTAFVQVDQALELSPEAPDLVTLRGEIEGARTAARERERILAEVARLSGAAREALENEQFDAALEQSCAALALAADDADLLALVEEIGEQRRAAEERGRIARETEQLLTTARTALETEAFEPALDNVRKAIALSPGHPAALALQQEIETRQAAAVERARVDAAVAAGLEQARNALANADFENALRLVDEALNLAPENRELGVLRATVEAEQTAAVERERIAAQVVRLAEEAKSALASGSFETAIAGVDEALALAPDDEALQGLRNQIETLLAEKQERERIRAETEQLLAAAREAVKGEDLDSAAGAVDGALSLEPDNVGALEIRAEIARLQQEAQARVEEQVVALSAAAKAFLDEQEFDAAAGKVSEALALAPDKEDLLSLAQAVEAQRLAAEERERIANETARLLARAKSEQADERFGDALETVNAALALTGDNPELEALRAQLGIQHEAALERERKARRLDELRTAALTQRSSGSLAAALESVDEALILAPDDGQLHALRGELVIQQRTAIESDQVVKEIALLKAQTEQLLAAGQRDAALETALAAITLSPNDASLRKFYSQIYRARQDAIREDKRQLGLAEAIENIESMLTANTLGTAGVALEEAMSAYPEEPRLVALEDRLKELERTGAPATPPAMPPTVETASTANARAQALIQGGDERLRLKDIASARLFYQAAIDGGAPLAATRLGMTYDPNALREIGAVGIKPDPEKALHWYRIGQQSGDPEAERRMERIRNQPSSQSQ